MREKLQEKRTEPLLWRSTRSIEEYISSQNKEIQPFLMSLTTVLRKAIEDYEEKILWSMPYIGKGGRFISYAANKDKVSLYVGEEKSAHFSSRTGKMKSRKSAVYHPYSEPFDEAIIRDLVRWEVEKD